MNHVPDSILAHAVPIDQQWQDFEREEKQLSEELRTEAKACFGPDVEFRTLVWDFGLGASVEVVIAVIGGVLLSGPAILKALRAWEEITRTVVGYFHQLRRRYRRGLVVSPEVAAALCLARAVEESQDQECTVETIVDLGDFHGEVRKALANQPLCRAKDPCQGRYVVVVHEPGVAHHFFVTDASGQPIVSSVVPWWF